MYDPRTINLATLEDLIADYLRRFNPFVPTPVPVPDAPLLHKLARWGKAFAIWYSDDRPSFEAIRNGAAEFVSQHYQFMVYLDVATENAETVFNVAAILVAKLKNGADLAATRRDLLVDLEQNPARYRRGDDTAPLAAWDDIWERDWLYLEG
jgi:hypothetical protein